MASSERKLNREAVREACCVPAIASRAEIEAMIRAYLDAAESVGAPRDDGLTPLERRVSDALCDAVNAFSLLDRQHPDEARDFRDAVHRLQDLMAMRIVRRDHPEGWPTYREVDGEWERIDSEEASDA